MTDCIETFEKDMSISKEEGFTFRMNFGDRIFHFMTDTALDRKNWITALRLSVKTQKYITIYTKIYHIFIYRQPQQKS